MSTAITHRFGSADPCATLPVGADTVGSVELEGLAWRQGEDVADAGAEAVVLALEPKLDRGAFERAVLDVDNRIETGLFGIDERYVVAVATEYMDRRSPR